jgi:hypothetical protein
LYGEIDGIALHEEERLEVRGQRSVSGGTNADKIPAAFAAAQRGKPPAFRPGVFFETRGAAEPRRRIRYARFGKTEAVRNVPEPQPQVPGSLRETLQKFFQRIIVFKVLEECVDRNPRAPEHGSATENFRIHSYEISRIHID